MAKKPQPVNKVKGNLEGILGKFTGVMEQGTWTGIQNKLQSFIDTQEIVISDSELEITALTVKIMDMKNEVDHAKRVMSNINTLIN